MLLPRAGDNGLSDFEYYRYVPNMGGAIFFTIAFVLTTVLHFYQMIRTRTWFMIPFCIGGIFELIGYIARAVSHTEAPDYTLGPYIIQSILLLVAPALFAASIYMELARIVLMVQGDHALFIRRTWLTRLFVSGDVFSFLMQSTGGGLMAKGGDSVNLGQNIIMGGLALQLIFFFLFVVAAAIFHFRIEKKPTSTPCNQYPWRKHMWSLYIVSILIFVRCVVRLVEYGQGWTGYILSHEAFLFVFDALLMFLSMVTMNWVHPSEVKALIRGDGNMVVGLVGMKPVGAQHSGVQTGPWA